MACIVCGDEAEPSAVGTPTCSGTCTGQLADQVLPEIADMLHAHPLPGVEPTPRPKARRSLGGGGASNLGRAREDVGDVRAVLERHGVTIRGKVALCPVHAERTPSMSLYERGGKSRAHCHGCGWNGDALDLEAALAGEDLATTIRRWST
jgi:CHC2 zinc finger